MKSTGANHIAGRKLRNLDTKCLGLLDEQIVQIGQHFVLLLQDASRSNSDYRLLVAHQVRYCQDRACILNRPADLP